MLVKDVMYEPSSSFSFANGLFFTTHKNSYSRCDRVEVPGANKVCFQSPPSRKSNFHHWLIYEPLGFPLEIKESFLILHIPLFCSCCTLTVFHLIVLLMWS